MQAERLRERERKWETEREFERERGRVFTSRLHPSKPDTFRICQLLELVWVEFPNVSSTESRLV